MRSTQSRIQAGSRRHRTKAEVEAILEEYRKSGLTQRVFAQEAGIGASTLQLWLRKQRARSERDPGKTSKLRATSGVPLIEVELAGAIPQGLRESESYEIELSNGNRLRLRSAFNDDSVRRLLGLMQEVR